MRALIILAMLVASNVATGAAKDPSPLPEPGTLGLLAAGALAAFKLRRKK